MPMYREMADRTEMIHGDSAYYQEAQEVVAGAGSLKEAVVGSRILDGLDEEQKQEVVAVLEAMPAEVDAAFMASVRDALAANQKYVFKWREGEFAHERIVESDGTLTLWLVCPDGRTFTGNT